MTAFEVKYRPVIVYADTFADLAAIPADLTLTKHAFILDSGDEYVLEPKSTVWQKLTDAEAAAIAELEAELDANRIYNTASSAAVCSFSDGADNIPMKSLIAEITPVQAGSGDPSPDNVRPISGWDGVTVTRTGKNLYDLTYTGATRAGVVATVNDGVITLSGTATESINLILSDTRDMPNGEYVLTGCPSGGSGSTYYLRVDNSVGGAVAVDYGSGSASFTISDGKIYTVYIRIFSGANVTGLQFKPMIRPASFADATFEVYNPQTIPITFPTPPGTVYGGTLDLISGVLTVTDANIASYAGETLPGTWISDRDVYAGGTAPTTGAQVVYKLAEPLVYQLDPVTIESLLGTNNLFADTGNTSAEYCADPKMYIDNAIASAVAALS